MNKKPSMITNVLDWIAKMIENREKNENKKKYFNENKDFLGIRSNKEVFYLVKCKAFDGKSLLEYIDSENVRLYRQREELIDLAIKIAELNHGERKTKDSMKEVINNFKSRLDSGVGLRDMIIMIELRYPWSTSKKIIMILISLMTCLFGIGLYVFDLKTDLEFSLEMINGTEENATSRLMGIGHYVYELTTSKDMTASLDIEDTELTGWFALWHCIQPFPVTFIVFFLMHIGKCSKPEVPDFFGIKYIPGFDSLWDSLKDTWHNVWYKCFFCLPFQLPLLLGYVLVYLLCLLCYFLCVLGNFLPIPAFTNIYRFYLDVRCHNARSDWRKFKIDIKDYEIEIMNHEALGRL